MLVAKTRKLVNRTLKEKYVGLKELEKVNSNKDVTTKYYVHKDTSSTGLKMRKNFLRLSKKERVKSHKNFVKQTTILSTKLHLSDSWMYKVKSMKQ